MNWETLLSTGDSITIGSRSYLGYPEYCAGFLSERTNKKWNVLNHSIAGFTTIDLARFLDENMANLKSAKPDIATILIGTNDLKGSTSSKIFRLAYELLITKVQLIVGSKNIILIEIPLLRDGVMLPYLIGMNEVVKEYNLIIQEICKTNNFHCLTLDCNDEYFYDGVHLNELGSEAIGRQVSNYILELRGTR